MAPRTRDTTKPTVYLDQSTLCDAFRAHLQPAGADPAYRPLLPWIERVAREANLCLSTAHIAEIGRWGDRASANALADWIDGLPTVWVRSMLDVGPEEDDFWTKIAAGFTPSSRVEPFTASLLAAFNAMTAEASTEAFGRPGSVHPFLDAARVYGFSKVEANMIGMIRNFQQNAAWADQQGWSDARKADDIAYNRRVDIRTRAEEARRRLNARRDPDLGGTDIDATVQDALVEVLDGDPLAMPSWRLTTAFSARFAEVARGLQAGSKKERALVSSFFDYQHLAVAAAHCDVFTCDRMVRDAVTPARQSLGRSAAFAPGQHPGGLAGFVADLMSTWP